MFLSSYSVYPYSSDMTGGAGRVAEGNIDGSGGDY